jgi:hypothetical protein
VRVDHDHATKTSDLTIITKTFVEATGQIENIYFQLPVAGREDPQFRETDFNNPIVNEHTQITSQSRLGRRAQRIAKVLPLRRSLAKTQKFSLRMATVFLQTPQKNHESKIVKEAL